MSRHDLFEFEDAVAHGDVAAAARLLAEGADPDVLAHGLERPVHHIAVRNEDLPMIRLLHERGADLELGRRRPLIVAEAQSRDGNPVLRLLVELGWEVDACDDAGWSALHVAASLGYIDNVRVLLSAGTDANLETSNGVTPEETAKVNGHIRLAAMLAKSVSGE